MGFRPFFLFAAFSGAFFPSYWASVVANGRPYFGSLMSPVAWHAHEMFFGFAQALLAGFLLTASANWTGKKPTQGRPLALLAILWIFEHFLLLIAVPRELAALGALSFQIVFTVLLFKALQGSPRNLVSIGVWSVFYLLAKTLWIYSAVIENESLRQISTGITLGLIRFIILLIAGRIIPFFSQKRFPSLKVEPPSWLQPLVLIPLGALCLPLNLVHPSLPIPFYFWAFVAVLVQFVFWKPQRTCSEPMLLILHTGILWMLVHFGMETLNGLTSLFSSFSVSIHAFTMGALGSFAIGMMTRVALGHTGRPIQSNRVIMLMFLCVTLGTMVRVGVPFFKPSLFTASLHWASGFWTLSFLVYLIYFTPILLKPRVTGS